MTTSVWDDPELRVSDDYVKFEQIGDTVTGTILSIRAHRFDDGKAVPQLLLDTASGERTVTAGQVRLKAALGEKRPEVGQVITITLSDIEKRSGGKTLKHFNVDIGGAATPAPAPSAPATPAPAAGNGYTPEQLEAMKLLGLTPPPAA